MLEAHLEDSLVLVSNKEFVTGCQNLNLTLPNWVPLVLTVTAYL